MSIRQLLNCAALVAFAAASSAQAQTLSATRSSLYFVYQRTAPGSSILTQTVDITSTANVPITVSSATQNGGAWLLVGQNNTTTPASLTVLVNPSIAPPLIPNVYTGSVSISPQGGATLTIPVTFVVSDLPLLQPASTTLRFQFSRGGQAPAAQPLGVTGTQSGINFSATGVTASGGDWLRIDPASGTTGAPGIPANVNVSIANAANLPVGTYSGVITLTAPGAGNNGLQINVILQVLEESRLSVSQASVSFDLQAGSGGTSDSVLFVTSTSGSIPFALQIVTETGGNWLSTPNPNATFTTPAQVPLTAAVAALAAGNYTAKLRIISTAATNSPLEVPATLRVTTDPIVTVSPSTGLRFSFQNGGPATPRQVVMVTSTTPVPFTVTTETTNGGQWLAIAPPRGGTPSPVVVGAEPGGLTPGTYNGTVKINGNFANSPVSIPVQLVVTAGASIRVSENYLSFAIQQGGAAHSDRVLQVTSTGAAAAIGITANSGGGWLTASLSAATTPANITVNVNPAGLPGGVYTGSISVAQTDGSTTPTVIPVRLLVSSQPVLMVSNTPLLFSHTVGRPLPDNQSLRILGSTPLAYTLTTGTADQNPWLVVSRAQGTTAPEPVSVGVNPGSLAPGVYAGVIAVTSNAVNSPQLVPIVLNLGGQAQDFTVTPVQLTFNQNAGAPAPPAQTLAVRLNPEGRVAFTVAIALNNGTNWLNVVPADGITPQDLTVTANGSQLPAGAYTGLVTITPVNAPNFRPITVPVTLNVNRILPNMNLTRETLNFTFVQGGPNVAAQTVSLTSSGDAFPFTVATQPQNSWLQATPPLGNAPAEISVSVNPGALSPGTYPGTVIVSSTSASNSPRIVNVTLTVNQPQAPVVTQVVHSATFQPTSAVPGLIVTLFIGNVGTIPATNLRIAANGNVDTTLANVRVLFDGTPAPMLFINSTQINCVVPYAVAGRATSRVQVESNGVLSQAIELRVVDAAPGMFRLNQAGQAAVVNENNTVNGASTPAPRNSIVTIYATGEGATAPVGVDGLVPTTAQQLRRPLLPVRVRIGGQDAEVVYAGSAPTLVSGVFQVNAVVAANAQTGAAVPIEVSVGTFTSPAGSTIAVQ